MADISPDGLLLYTATCCCFSALYTDFPALVGCSGKNECLCIEEEFCAKLGTPIIPIKFETGNGYICKLGLAICSCGLKMPTICLKGKGQCCCFVSQAALPPDNDVPLMCAICFFCFISSYGIFNEGK